MAFTTSTSPSEDIIVQEGTFAFDYDASGSVFAGQAVYINGSMAVAAVPATSIQGLGVVGVAAYDQTNGNPVAVYGPGNICRVIISGTSKCTQGDHLVSTYEGKFSKITGLAAGPSGVSAIALETQATADGTAKVLLM